MVISTIFARIRTCKLEGDTIVSGEDRYSIENIKEIDIDYYKLGYYTFIIMYILLAYPFVTGIYMRLSRSQNNYFDYFFVSCVAIIIIVSCFIAIRILKKLKDYKHGFIVNMGVSVYFEESDSPDDYETLKQLCKE
jgi:hypothetical protein